MIVVGFIEKYAQYVHVVGFVFYGLVNSTLDYDMLNVEVPTLPLVGSLIKAGVRVLIYR